MRYPQGYLRFSEAMFFVFAAIGAFANTADLAHARELDRLISFAMGSAVVMWLVIDAMTRRREVPFVSLHNVFAAWVLILPLHYFATRRRAGVRGLVLRLGVALGAMGAGALAGVLFAGGPWSK
jgi:hypothetical protein